MGAFALNSKAAVPRRYSTAFDGLLRVISIDAAERRAANIHAAECPMELRVCSLAIDAGLSAPMSLDSAEILVQPTEHFFHKFGALRCYVVWRFKHDVPLVGCG